MDTLISQVHSELKKHAEPAYKKAAQWFFKEGITLYGVRVGTVRKIANEYFRQIKPRDKATVFALCDELLAEHLQETSVVAYQWAARMQKELSPNDFRSFEHWLKTYVRNWAQCDDLCTGPLGELLVLYPQLIPKTKSWRTSRNRWVRRGAAVSLILPAKKAGALADAFACAEALLEDEDDMVRKGYGWLLKEASNVYPNDVFQFVMKRKDRMPRVALRFAIEKLPKQWRQQAMR